MNNITGFIFGCSDPYSCKNLSLYCSGENVHCIVGCIGLASCTGLVCIFKEFVPNISGDFPLFLIHTCFFILTWQYTECSNGAKCDVICDSKTTCTHSTQSCNDSQSHCSRLCVGVSSCYQAENVCYSNMTGKLYILYFYSFLYIVVRIPQMCVKVCAEKHVFRVQTVILVLYNSLNFQYKDTQHLRTLSLRNLHQILTLQVY